MELTSRGTERMARVGADTGADMAMGEAQTQAVERVIAGQYRLKAQIGQGAMGAVWRAEQVGWSVPVAVKLIRANRKDPKVARLRFERELQMLVTLRSPHVVQVLNSGVDEQTGEPFIVMELLDGESLGHRIRRLGKLSARETLSVAVQVSRALGRAKKCGVVHRDLKPENVFVCSNDDEADFHIKVLDFGLAKALGPEAEENSLTCTGVVMGTPYYMSPEHIRASEDMDHRADLWSLSVIVFECITGRRPFDTESFGELVAQLCGDAPRTVPSSIAPVPAGFDQWFAKATARSIQDRFQTSKELVRSLEECLKPELAEQAARAPTLRLDDIVELSSSECPSVAPCTTSDDTERTSTEPFGDRSRFRWMSLVTIGACGLGLFGLSIGFRALQNGPKPSSGAQSEATVLAQEAPSGDGKEIGASKRVEPAASVSAAQATANAPKVGFEEKLVLERIAALAAQRLNAAPFVPEYVSANKKNEEASKGDAKSLSSAEKRSAKKAIAKKATAKSKSKRRKRASKAKNRRNVKKARASRDQRVRRQLPPTSTKLVTQTSRTPGPTPPSDQDKFLRMKGRLIRNSLRPTENPSRGEQ